MNICPPNQCTGCFACVSSCPRHCITMREDEYGELHPLINDDRCIKCGVCQKSCPNNGDLVLNYPLHCYASWTTDVIKRKKCASGGIGTIISEFVINNYDTEFAVTSTLKE